VTTWNLGPRWPNKFEVGDEVVLSNDPENVGRVTRIHQATRRVDVWWIDGRCTTSERDTFIGRLHHPRHNLGAALVLTYRGLMTRPHIPPPLVQGASIRVLAEMAEIARRRLLFMRRISRYEDNKDFKVNMADPMSFWETLNRRKKADEYDTEDAHVVAGHRRRRSKGCHSGRGVFSPGKRHRQDQNGTVNRPY